MRELLKINHGYCDEQKADSLCDYGLCVHEGDIFYVQGLEGTGLKTLIRVISGDCKLERGSLFLWEEKMDSYDRNIANQKGIYVISGENDLIEEMTVADNLEAVRHVPFLFSQYDKRKALLKAEEYLRYEQVDVPAGAYVWSLKRKNKQKLSIVKAKMHGAKLIILDVTGYSYGGIEAQELCELIRKIHEEGISFLIVSECYSMFAEIATRIQIISHGRDLKEWSYLNDRVRQILLNQAVAVPEQESTNDYGFLGMYDYEWEMREGFWEYLRHVCRNNKSLWDTYIKGGIPKDGCSKMGGTVVIPVNSTDLLLNHLKISDNLILPISDRVARRKLGVIRNRIQKNIMQQYLAATGADPSAAYPGELNRVQRKILSIYRYALTRPERIILENPYCGLSFYETRQLRDYLKTLQNKGTCIIYFSKNLQEFREDCSMVLVTKGGNKGKMATIS